MSRYMYICIPHERIVNAMYSYIYMYEGIIYLHSLDAYPYAYTCIS